MEHIGLIVIIVLIVAAIEYWRFIRKKRKSGADKLNGNINLPGKAVPAVFLIQAADARQHAGKLLEILQKLKHENRIVNFTTYSADEDLSSLPGHAGDEDVVLIVLTYQLQSQKEQIVKAVRAAKEQGSPNRTIEIIVDNVAYNNEFVTLPEDLNPIRNREDTDTAWNNIEENLRGLLPAHVAAEPVRPEPHTWQEYLKLLPKIIGKAVVVYFVILAIFIGLIFLVLFAILDETFGKVAEWLFIITLLAALIVAILFAIGKVSGNKNQHPGKFDQKK